MRREDSEFVIFFFFASRSDWWMGPLSVNVSSSVTSQSLPARRWRTKTRAHCCLADQLSMLASASSHLIFTKTLNYGFKECVCLSRATTTTSINESVRPFWSHVLKRSFSQHKYKIFGIFFALRVQLRIIFHHAEFVIKRNSLDIFVNLCAPKTILQFSKTINCHYYNFFMPIKQRASRWLAQFGVKAGKVEKLAQM